jgi:drug/metabolite transporter (DMT)-like permease
VNKKQQTNSAVLGSLFALGATAIWAGNYIIARGLNEVIPPVTLAFYRWFVAVLVFTPFAIQQVRSQWPAIKRSLIYLCVTGALGVSAFNTLLYIASQTTSAINLSLMSLTFPIFMVILSVLFLKEKITIMKAAGIGLVVIGVIVLVTRGELNTLFSLSFAVGDIWMLLGAFLWSVYSLLLKRKSAELNAISFQYSTFVLGLLFLVPFFLIERANFPPVALKTNIVLSILYIGVISSLVAYYLWNRSIELVGPSKAAIIFYSSPLFIGLLAYVFLNESIGLIHLYSALLIIPGILLANYEKSTST